MLLLPLARTCGAGLALEARIPWFWDNAVLVISGTGSCTVCSFLPQYEPEGLILVSGCYTGTLCYSDRPERPRYGSRSRAGLTGRDFRDVGACLHMVPQIELVDQSDI